MLTLFTTFKMDGRVHHYRNAIRSWCALGASVIVFTNEQDVLKETVDTLCCIPWSVRASQYGTPYLSDMIRKAHTVTGRYFGYVNADIILDDSLTRALEICRRGFPRFLLGGSRWNIRVDGEVHDFDAITKQAHEAGNVYYAGADWFVWSGGDWWGDIPDLLVGRNWFDWWFVGHALALGIPVINGTDYVIGAHQDHPSIVWPDPTPSVTEEVQHNSSLVCGMVKQWNSAPYYMTEQGEIIGAD